MRSKFVLAIVGLMLAGAAPAQTAVEPAAAPPLDPRNVLDLDLSTGGRVKILLRPDKAPHSVERIKILVARHFYDGLKFHRVIEGFMAQTGDPKGTGEGGSDLPDLKAEFNDLPHVRGTMSMARAEAINSANSQFFIMLQPNLGLDGNYTPIGRVISGMEYVDAIEKGEPPEKPSTIVHAAFEADGPALINPVPEPAAAAPGDKTSAAVDAVAGDEGVAKPKAKSKKKK